MKSADIEENKKKSNSEDIEELGVNYYNSQKELATAKRFGYCRDLEIILMSQNWSC